MLLVQLVRMRKRSRSQTTNKGGFSKASAYCCSWANAASKSFRWPLYSQPKCPRFQTSAQPSPPVVLVAPRSNAYHSPLGSASVGLGSSNIRHRSMKCDCAADRSLRSAAFHLAINCSGITCGSRLCACLELKKTVAADGVDCQETTVLAERPCRLKRQSN